MLKKEKFFLTNGTCVVDLTLDIIVSLLYYFAFVPIILRAPL